MYIIKKYYKATEKNPNFYSSNSENLIWVCGKKGYSEKFSDYLRAPQWFNENYAYSSRTAAEKGLKAAQKSCDSEARWGYWTAVCEIVEV